jgi:hypothetical protein
VETDVRHVVVSAFQQVLLVLLRPRRRRVDVLAALEVGWSRAVSSMKRYCVHVSPQTCQPFPRAIAIGSIDSLHETWTT